ncbi:LacI family DNA-binding transcriptional regulator [Thalassospira sp.]|uniref:LacI family DNA-binding transcriptional regulator n=1 Tax=Thalassospira sp. TaxID=1912094 RepID=UPI00273354A8|nr:LacI family DNA-binding transcriptional regulator [Thalassospira sp.]MDP2697604.1 LacI family DNA-binding transcriptional regulator [Thalassospira sp.]
MSKPKNGTVAAPVLRHHTVTSADVAREAGVARSTVSRCLSGDSRISEATRDRVVATAERLGYQINKIARSMNTRKSDLIGLVTSGLSDPFRVEFLDHLIAAIQQAGFRPLVIDVSDPALMETSMLNLLQYQIAGIVVTSGSPPPAIGQHFLRRDVPVVLVNRAGLLEGADVINCDNIAGGQLAAEILLASGKRRLGFLNMRGGTYSGNARGEAFVAAIAPELASGAVSFTPLSCNSADYDGGFQAGLKFLGKENAPDAIFCGKDHIALGLMDAARFELGLKVPDDLAIVGFDDIVAAGQRAYRLTTIAQSPARLAALTIGRLKQRIAGEVIRDERLILPVELVRRETV